MKLAGLDALAQALTLPIMTDVPVKRPKRPRDPAQLAKLIVDIATGEVEDREPTPEELGKSAAAVELGKRGGRARAQSMTAERRAQVAKKAAEKRWRDR